MKEENGNNFMKNNKNVIVAFAAGVLITGAICGILWPSRIAKLSDGSEVVASINGTSISADALYSELNSRGGLSTLLEMIDEEILRNKYNLDKEAAAYADEQSKGYYEQWESIYGYTKEQFLSNNGFKTEDDFLHYLENEFYKNKYVEDYLNSKVKDEDVETYYNDVVKEERRAYVFYTTEDDKDLTKVKKSLEKGTAIDKLSDKYSSLTYRDLGNVNFNSYNMYTDKFLTELNKLKKGEVSKVFTDENFGNVIIYVSDVKEKEEFDTVKDQIRSNLAQKMNEEDSNLYYRAFQELRKEYNLKIEDQNIQKEYDEFIETTKEQ